MSDYSRVVGMEVLHPRCAELDVHLHRVVAYVYVQIASGDAAQQEVRTFRTTTVRDGVLFWARFREFGSDHAAESNSHHRSPQNVEMYEVPPDHRSSRHLLHQFGFLLRGFALSSLNASVGGRT
jgi:hypothetical protein